MQQTNAILLRLFSSFLTLLILLFWQSPSYSQSEQGSQELLTFKISTKSIPADYDRQQLAKTFTNYKIFEVSFAELRQQSMNLDQFIFHLQLGNDVNWQMNLTNEDLRGVNYKETIRKNGRQVTPSEKRKSFNFKGHLVNNPSPNHIRMNIADHFLSGYVQLEGKQTYIEPLYFTDPSAPKNYYLVYRPEDVIRSGAAGCSINHIEEHFFRPEDYSSADRSPNSECLEVDLVTACTYDFVALFGNPAEANDRIVAITNLVQGLYDPFNIQYIIQEQFAPATLEDDPFTESVDANDILQSMKTFAGPNLAEHDIGQIWTGRDITGCGLGSNLIGCAMSIGGVCGDFRYNLCENWNGNSECLRTLSAHEFGHNWGMVHDDQSTPFVMTPFIQCNATEFSPNSIMAIENHIASRTCLASCCPEGEECGSNGPDLRIVMTGSEEDPPLWNYHNVTVTLLNEGDEDATGIIVAAPKAASSVYEGGVIYTASQGTYDEISTQTWNVGTIPAGESAILTLAYFRVSEVPFFQYAEVISMNEDDVDSTPGNGNGTTANEDDEGIYPNNEVDPCNPDLTPPVFTFCPEDITVQTTMAPTSVTWTVPTAEDNCQLSFIVTEFDPGDQFPAGSTEVEYTSGDDNGNIASCNFTVTVIEEGTPPEICENNILPDPGFEQGFGFGAWTTADANAQVTTDAYSGEQAMELTAANSLTRIYHNAIPITAGENYTLSAYAKSSGGNAFAELFIKYMSINYQPILETGTVISAATYSQFSISETAPTNAAYIEVGIRKGAGDYIVKADEFCLSTGEVNPPDPCNPDVVPPVFSNCPSSTIEQISNTVPVAVSFISPTATDNCTMPVISANFYSGDLFPEGLSTVHFEAVDAAGNLTSCTFNVNVIVENGPPSAQPDLILDDLLSEATVGVGDILEYTFSLSNIGDTVASGDFNIKAYFSTDPVFSSDDIFNGTVPTGNVAAGQVIENVMGASTVPDLPPGDYFLILKVDADEQVAESDENNNTVFRTILIEADNPPTEGCNADQSITSGFPWHEWISRFRLDIQTDGSYALDNESGKSTYSNFGGSLPAINIQRGQQMGYAVDITYSYFTFANDIRVYTDFNQDGFFDETEFSSVGVNPIPPGNQVSVTRFGTEMVPADAALGVTRVRVIMSRNPVSDACSDIEFGEVEDYLINITDAPGASLRNDREWENQFRIYPNPVNNEFTLEVSSEFPVQTVQVVNAYGHVKWASSMDQRQGGDAYRRIKINTSDWINGVYLVQLIGPFKTRTRKMIVQRTY